MPDPSSDCLLSVVIPTYNYAAILPRAVGSVLAQLRPDCELIVVDDGSEDDTSTILECLEAASPGAFVWRRQANAGAGAARNHGLRISRGRYVLFLDADDELLPGTLDAACGRLRDHPEAGVILGGNVSRHPDGREKYSGPGEVPADPCARLAAYLLDKRLNVGHGSLVARRDLFEARPYPENFRNSEDLPVFAYLLAHTEPLRLEHPMVKVYKHPDSLRHRAPKSGDEGVALVEEVFRCLPPACQRLRRPYAAQRCLSLFRSALSAGDVVLAKGFFRKALSFDRRQALKWTYLKKALRMWLMPGLSR